MTALILLIQPIPAPPAEEIRPAGFLFVDIIVVNQYTQRMQCDGRATYRTNWYDSYWRIHWFPPFGTCRVAVWEHCGWRVSRRLLPCADGWAADNGGNCVIAPSVLNIATDYDFEYHNRQWKHTEPAPMPLP